jgi:hypothetical protein
MGRLIALPGDRPEDHALRHQDDGQPLGAWGALSESLWPAWNGMLRAEGRVLEAFGEVLGEKLLVLWALSRFGEGGLGDGSLAELVDEQGRPRFGDWLAEDMLFAAFSLGVAWVSEGLPEARTPARAPGRPADPGPRRRAV